MPTPGKVLSQDRLLALRAQARSEGRTLVQCHGCFDIVHPGHIRHLRQARTYGDILLVSITGDSAFTKRSGSPLIPEELRADNLAELDCVDWVYVDERPTAGELLEEVRPDVYVKGREYEHNADPRFAAERATVERHGGRVVFSSGDIVFSSTALIASLERSADPYQARLAQLLEQPSLDGSRLNAIISAFRGKRVAVVGETIIDEYVLCDQPEIAGESPVMTLRPLERRRYDGGAAIIARHLAAMGARPILVTALPDSAAGSVVRQRLAAAGIDVRVLDTDSPLAEKQRFLVGAQKVMKLNLLEPMTLDATKQDELIELARDAAHGCDAGIIADFGNGLLTGASLPRLCAAMRPSVRILSGDVSGRRSSLLHFAEMDLLCPSEGEMREALRDFGESIPTAVSRLLDQTHSRAAIVTMGADGLIAFEPSGAPASAARDADPFASRLRSEHVPALCGFAVDPLGCGDAMISAATLALASGGDLLAASLLGAISASCEAQRLGNVPISGSDLRHGVVRLHTSRLMFTGGAEAGGVPATAGTGMARESVAR